VQAGYVCKNVTQTMTKPVPRADFLFLIDASGSMCPYIAGVKAGLIKFSKLINSTGMDARFSLVRFGGNPQVRLPFTGDLNALKSSLDEMPCNAGGQEAAFEAIRRVLPPFEGKDMVMKCPSAFGGTTDPSQCNTVWRTNAAKVIILATDEDSDLPMSAAHRGIGQMAGHGITFCQGNYDSAQKCIKSANWEPAFSPAILSLIPGTKEYTFYRSGPNLTISKPFLDEITNTTNRLLVNGVFLNSLVSLTVGTDYWKLLPVSAFNVTSAYFKAKSNSKEFLPDGNTVATLQFGHPDCAAQGADYSNFDADTTLKCLESTGLGVSMQSQILRSQESRAVGKRGLMRVFDIARFVNGADMNVIEAFYEQLIETTAYLQTECVLVPDPPSPPPAPGTTRIVTTIFTSTVAPSTSLLSSTFTSTSQIPLNNPSLEATPSIATPSLSSEILSSPETSSEAPSSLTASSETPLPSTTNDPLTSEVIVSTKDLTPTTTPTQIEDIISSTDVPTVATPTPGGNDDDLGDAPEREDGTIDISQFFISGAPAVNPPPPSPPAVNPPPPSPPSPPAAPPAYDENFARVKAPTVDNNVIIIVVAAIGSVVAVVGAAAVYMLHRRRRAAQLFASSGAELRSAAIQNPMYQQASYNENPLFESKSRAFETSDSRAVLTNGSNDNVV
jgi:hypothetical protein